LSIAVRLMRDCIANSIYHAKSRGVVKIPRKIITFNDCPHVKPVNGTKCGMNYWAWLQFEVAINLGARNHFRHIRPIVLDKNILMKQGKPTVVPTSPRFQ